ncbi:hypothetical protein ACHQM5_013689 [Ranunculus cassubicifolius]
MSGNKDCTVYLGNIDESVSEKTLYEILVQAGRIIDLYIPQDKDTNRRKGFAFAEYETEEIADYAVRLFSDTVTINKKALKFGISGKDKPLQNKPAQVQVVPIRNPIPKPRSYQPKKKIHSNRYDYNRQHFRNQIARTRRMK